MRVLLLAPQPFYQERGTPIAVDLLLRALSARGDAVDLLAYHEGSDVRHPKMRLHRIPWLPFVRRVGPGLSAKKLVCDAVFFIKALWMAARTRYDMVHAVEESAFMALIIKRVFGLPYVYDMDSSISEQVVNKHRWLAPLRPMMRWMEGLVIRDAEAVVPVCDALAEIATRAQARRVVVLRDVSLLSFDGGAPRPAADVRAAVGASGPIVMYIGNLEAYQGIGLLLESFALARRRVPAAHLVVIGGQEAGIRRYQVMADRLGLNGSAHFLGPRPVAQIAGHLHAADILVSPRIQGGNTPMKIYSYLHSGKPVLATELPTHTQVLTDEVALLRPPTLDAFADGLVRLLQDAALRQRLGQSGRALVESRHSYAAFRTALHELYDGLDGQADEIAATPTDAPRGFVKTAVVPTLAWCARASISVFLLWLIVRKLDLASILELLHHVQWGWLAVGFAGLVVNRWLAIQRMIILIKAKGITFKPQAIAQIVLGSQFYGQFLPTSVGGDVLRVYSLSRHTDNATESASAVLVERALGVVALLMLGVLGALWAWPHLRDHRIFWLALLPSSIGILVSRIALDERSVAAVTRWLDLRGHRWARKPFAWLKAIRAYGRHRAAMNRVLLASLAMHFFRVMAFYCSARALGSSLPFVYFAAIVPLILLTSQMPISIGGWGVRENLFVHSFAQVGLAPAMAFSMSVISQLMQVIATVPGGMWSIFSQRRAPRSPVVPVAGLAGAMAADKTSGRSS